MRIRYLLLVLVMLAVIFLLKPKAVWSEYKRIRGQWNTILTLLVIVVGVYLLFGFWRAYVGTGGIPW